MNGSTQSNGREARGAKGEEQDQGHYVFAYWAPCAQAAGGGPADGLPPSASRLPPCTCTRNCCNTPARAALPTRLRALQWCGELELRASTGAVSHVSFSLPSPACCLAAPLGFAQGASNTACPAARVCSCRGDGGGTQGTTHLRHLGRACSKLFKSQLARTSSARKPSQGGQPCERGSLRRDTRHARHVGAGAFRRGVGADGRGQGVLGALLLLLTRVPRCQLVLFNRSQLLLNKDAVDSLVAHVLYYLCFYTTFLYYLRESHTPASRPPAARAARTRKTVYRIPTNSRIMHTDYFYWYSAAGRRLGTIAVCVSSVCVEYLFSRHHHGAKARQRP